MQENTPSAEEFDQLCQQLIEQARGVRRKWRDALEVCAPGARGYSDLVRYIKFIIRTVGETATVFTHKLREPAAQRSPQDMQDLWDAAQQSRQTLEVLSAQCDDFLRKHVTSFGTGATSEPGPHITLRQLREAGRHLALDQRHQSALIKVMLGQEHIGGDPLAARALHAMAHGLAVEKRALRRRRLAMRGLARHIRHDGAVPEGINLPARLERCLDQLTLLREHWDSRERYLAHLVTLQ